jgi:MoxR-like ATPase
LDRFMFSVQVDGHAHGSGCAGMNGGGQKPALAKILNSRQILELHRAIRELPASDHVVKYAVRLVRSTRPSDKRAPDFVRKYIHSGAGPRAAQDLVMGAKAHAVMEGHLSVTPADIRAVAPAALRHRIFTNFTAESEGVDANKIVERLVAEVEEPGLQAS